MANLDVRAAKWAKDNGYTHMTTVVKSVFATTYYNVQDVDHVIQHGKWIGAAFMGNFNCRQGLRCSEFEELNTVARQEARDAVKELTCGVIDPKMVKKYVHCLKKCDGEVREAILMADKKYNLNASATTVAQDSLHEAIAQYTA